jgi:hypothetical protein
VLHNRLGHPNDAFLRLAFPGVPFKTIDYVINMDLCGPILPMTPSKLKYFLVVVDGKSQF